MFFSGFFCGFERCAGEDSNLHARYRHIHLKDARLPITTPARYNCSPTIANILTIFKRFRDRHGTFCKGYILRSNVSVYWFSTNKTSPAAISAAELRGILSLPNKKHLLYFYSLETPVSTTSSVLSSGAAFASVAPVKDIIRVRRSCRRASRATLSRI